MEEIIKPVIPNAWLNEDTKIYINPTGSFVIGGPVGDCVRWIKQTYLCQTNQDLRGYI